MNSNREQREAELREMLATPDGKDALLATLKGHMGLPAGAQPPAGTLLVDAILNYEFPQPEDKGRPAAPEPASATAREGSESGDKKFNDPPGAESPGG
jgi:hypothetical protein